MDWLSSTRLRPEQDREGKDMLLCAGQTIAAREQMEGATVQPIEPEG